MEQRKKTGIKPTNGFKKGHKLSARKRNIRPEVARRILLNRIKRGRGRGCINDQVWRKAVLKRDNYECKKCFSSEKLCVHHVKCWKKFPELRFDVENGLTLCRQCHGKAHREELLERLKNIVPWNKGMKMSAAHRKKLSDAHKGQVPWNKGLKLRKECSE